MGKKFLFIISCLLQVFLFSNISFALNFFEVKKIPVSAVSYSSSQAKKDALAIARSNAFNTVISRLLLSSNVSNVIIPDSYNLEKFVQGVKLNNEKTTSTSYSADVDVIINKSLMEDYLSNQGFSFLSDIPPQTLLVLLDGDVLDFSNSDYKKSLSNVVKFNTYVSKKNEAEVSDFDYLLSSYGANNIIVVSQVHIGEGVYEINFKDKLLGINETFETEYDKFAKDLVQNINDAYKKIMFERSLNEYVSLIVPIYSLADWVDIKKKFSKIPVFKDMIVQALKFNRAQIKVKYRYDLNSVMSALSSLGYSVENKDNYLIIKR